MINIDKFGFSLFATTHQDGQATLTKYYLHTIQTLFEEKRWRGTVIYRQN